MSNSTTDPAAAAAAAAALQEAIYVVKAEQIFFCSMYAVCIWDWLVSLKREWNLIWKSEWSVVKVLYLLCRYWVIIDIPYVLWQYVEDHSVETCLKIFRAPPALAMWNQFWAEGILLVRTYAFLGKRIEVLIPLMLGLAAVAAYQLFVICHEIALLPFFMDPTAGPCFPTVTFVGSSHVMGFWIAPLCFDTLVTALTLWHAWQVRRRSGGLGSPLLKTFVSEGIWYFVLIDACNLLNGIFYWQPKAVLSALFIPFSIMFAAVLACRMTLSLREEGGLHSSSKRQRSDVYSHTSRRIKPAGPAGISQRAKNSGVVTDMGFNHELTTFERDVKTQPYEGNPEATMGDIRVDIERQQHYESSDEAHEKPASFVP